MADKKISEIQFSLEKITYLDFSKERALKGLSKSQAIEECMKDWIEKCKKERKG